MRRGRGKCAWLKTGVALALLAWGTGAGVALELVAPLGVDEPVIPEANPLTPEKVALGQQLFFDPRLSADDSVSCASCHDPRKGFSNGERVGIGIRGQRGTRNVPTVLNAALNGSNSQRHRDRMNRTRSRISASLRRSPQGGLMAERSPSP